MCIDIGDEGTSLFMSYQCFIFRGFKLQVHVSILTLKMPKCLERLKLIRNMQRVLPSPKCGNVGSTPHIKCIKLCIFYTVVPYGDDDTERVNAGHIGDK